MRRLTAFVASLSFLLLADAHADDSRLFRLGTGGEGGSYYPIGTAIARALTPPGDGKPCKAATCGIDNLVAVAQISNGSVSNVEGIRTGALEGGIAQADIVHWAYTGTGTFAAVSPTVDYAPSDISTPRAFISLSTAKPESTTSPTCAANASRSTSPGPAPWSTHAWC